MIVVASPIIAAPTVPPAASAVVASSATISASVSAAVRATVHSAVSAAAAERRGGPSKRPLSAPPLSGRLDDDGHSEQAVPVQLIHRVLGVARRLKFDEAEVDLLPPVLEVEVDQFPVITEQVLHVPRVRAVRDVADIQTVLRHWFPTS